MRKQSHRRHPPITQIMVARGFFYSRRTLCQNRKKAALSAITVPVNFLSATWHRYTASVRGQSESALKSMTGYARERAVRKSGTHNGKVRTSPKANIKAVAPDNDINPYADYGDDDMPSLDPRKYGLNDMQWRFVNEYLIDLNRTAAYKRAGGKGEGNTAYVSASRMYRNAKVNRAISDALAARERRTQITQDAVLKMCWDIATADVNQITEYRRLCCRYCWGFGHQYQWMDAVEHEEASVKAKAANKPEPSDRGGYGFDAMLDPNPECPRCNGAGVGRAHFHDSRDLTGAARRLFAGIKEGKFGIEVITRNQDDR